MEILLLLSLALSGPVPLQENQGVGWSALFDGKSLDGWSAHGGAARFTVEEGAIVGESVAGTTNSFLCTQRSFGDFELELEFRVDPALNSGVQIRSEVFPEARRLEVDGKTIELPPDRVHGYQVEIDVDPARDRWWSGGIYDEMRRGWLDPAGEQKASRGAAFTEQGRRLSRDGQWSALRIVARGAEIATWLDGEPRARVSDSLTPAGFIALQVHGVGDDPAKVGLKVRFRSLRLRMLGKADAPSMPHNLLGESELREGWRLLWDGRTSHGWRSAASEQFPARGWTMRDGVLTVERGSGGESAGGGDLLTRARFASFELALDFRLSAGANSGFKYFVQPDLRPIDANGVPAATGSAIGCEYQLLDDLRHPDAKLGRDGNRTLASLYDLIPATAEKRPNAIGEWNTARIVARGPRVEHWLNGGKVLEYERGSGDFRRLVAESKYRNIPGFGEWPDGHVLLQDHGDEVSFRNLKIRVLAP